MPKDRIKSEIIDLVLIGDGPLFNHCVNFLRNNKFKIYIITSLNNSKKLNIKKNYFINYKKLYKIKKINFLLSIMNGKIIEKNILKKVEYPIISGFFFCLSMLAKIYVIFLFLTFLISLPFFMNYLNSSKKTCNNFF